MMNIFLDFILRSNHERMDLYLHNIDSKNSKRIVFLLIQSRCLYSVHKYISFKWYLYPN